MTPQKIKLTVHKDLVKKLVRGEEKHHPVASKGPVDSSPDILGERSTFIEQGQITYVSVHQFAVVLHLVCAVLIGNVSLFSIFIDVWRQFLSLVVQFNDVNNKLFILLHL